MKRLLLITLFVSVGLSQNRVNVNNLVQYGDKIFRETDDRPFNGMVFDISKETGNKILEYKMLKGVKNGIYKEWYPNGTIKTKGKYLNGIEDRMWSIWYQNGQKEREGRYKDGVKDGLWSEWDLNGKIKEEVRYSGDYKIEETIYSYYENGNNKSKEKRANGKRNGLFTYWNENGLKLKEGKYRNGLMEGEWYFLVFNKEKEKWRSLKGSFKSGDGGNPNKISGVPLNGRNGLFTGFYSNGQKKSIRNYKDGVLDGLTTDWYENGQMSLQATFNDGIMIGKIESWFDDGTQEREYYNNDDGTRDSTKLTIRWYTNGQKRIEAYMTTINGEAEWRGAYTSWDEDGNVQYEGTYLRNGKWEGKDFNWYENGQKRNETTYKDGELISKEEWNRDGSVKE